MNKNAKNKDLLYCCYQFVRNECKIIGPWPPPQSFSDMMRIFFGAVMGIGLLAWMSMQYSLPVLVPSFGASACLIFYVPNGPFSQPRNVILGHTMAAATGVAALYVCGSTWYGAGLSVAGAIIAMLLTGSMHPPAAATALIAVLTQQDFWFPLLPVACGAATLMLIGMIANRLVERILLFLADLNAKRGVAGPSGGTSAGPRAWPPNKS